MRTQDNITSCDNFIKQLAFPTLDLLTLFLGWFSVYYIE